MFLSLCLYNANFNLLKINLFNYKHNFSVDALQLKKANAIDEIIANTTTKNKKKINNTNNKENEKKNDIQSF